MNNRNFTSLEDMMQIFNTLSDANPEDRVRTMLQTMYNLLIHADTETKLGAAPYERSNERTTYRNGFREKLLTTAAGEITTIKSANSRLRRGRCI